MQSESVMTSLNKSLTSEDNEDSINEFMTRVQTYIVGQKWIKKPLALSPAVCSQYGWKCIKSDLLECVTCGVKLSAHQPSISNFVAYKACIEKMISDLKDHHGKHCPWPLTPSPENFVKMIPMPREEALNQFLNRMKACLTLKHCLPKIKESGLDLSDYHIAELCKLAGISSDETCSFGKSIVSLASTGWFISKETEFEKTVFRCNNCHRSVSCNVFSLLDSTDSPNKENETITEDNAESCEENCIEPPTKRVKKSFIIKNGEPFNPLHEHRPWCLWVFKGREDYVSPTQTEADQNKDSMPGWKIFMKSLLRNVTENESPGRKSPSKEQIRNVKSLLEQWT